MATENKPCLIHPEFKVDHPTASLQKHLGSTSQFGNEIKPDVTWMEIFMQEKHSSWKNTGLNETVQR